MYLAVFLMLLLMIWCQHSSFLKSYLLKAVIQHILRVHNKGTKVNRSLSFLFFFFFGIKMVYFQKKWNLQIVSNYLASRWHRDYRKEIKGSRWMFPFAALGTYMWKIQNKHCSRTQMEFDNIFHMRLSMKDFVTLG